MSTQPYAYRCIEINVAATFNHISRVPGDTYHQWGIDALSRAGLGFS